MFNTFKKSILLYSLFFLSVMSYATELGALKAQYGYSDNSQRLIDEPKTSNKDLANQKKEDSLASSILDNSLNNTDAEKGIKLNHEKGFGGIVQEKTPIFGENGRSKIN